MELIKSERDRTEMERAITNMLKGGNYEEAKRCLALKAEEDKRNEMKYNGIEKKMRVKRGNKVIKGLDEDHSMFGHTKGYEGGVLAVWHFTMKATEGSWEEERDLLVNFMEGRCKMWLMQLEKSAPNPENLKNPGGYLHFQGKFSLEEPKKRLVNLSEEMFDAGLVGFRLSPCAANSVKLWDYVCKDETRIEGPWGCEKFYPKPRVIRMINRETQRIFDNDDWYDWQRVVIESKDSEHPLHNFVNIIVDPKGAAGKSTLTERFYCVDDGCVLPTLQNSKDLLQYIDSEAKQLGTIDPRTNVHTAKAYGVYILDIPRGLNHVDLPKSTRITREAEFWAGCEKLQDGFTFETRYKGSKRYFKKPCVWVFSNNPPYYGCISQHKFRAWMIVDGKLEPYIAPEVAPSKNQLDGIDKMILSIRMNTHLDEKCVTKVIEEAKIAPRKVPSPRTRTPKRKED